MCFFTLTLTAQTTIEGTVMDEGDRVEFCNLLVLNPSDSSFLYGEGVVNGEFNLKVEQSNFILKVEALGFDDLFIKINGSTNLGQVKLNRSELKAVEVFGQKLPFESLNGNTKINVANSIFQSSSSIQELLNKSPGVILTNGGVSVIGRGEALIYLNRKQISLPVLQAIPIAQIQSIEIIKNPDASYDAEGKAIVLVVLKELGLEGVQGTVTTHYTKGFYHLGFVDVNLNAKKGKWDLSAGVNTNFGTTGSKRVGYYDVKEELPYIANTDYKEKVYLPHVYNYLLGVKYQINPKHSVSTQFNGNYSRFDLEVENNISQIINNQEKEIETIDMALSYEQANIFSANYNFKIDSLGSNFFAGLTYSSVLVSYSDSVDEVVNFNGVSSLLNSQSNGKNVNNIGSIQFDYQKNYSNSNQLKVGAKVNTTLSNSSVFLETVSADSLINSRNNAFNYNEQVISSYANWNGIWKKGEYHLGLRAEYSENIAIRNKDSDAYIDTNYLSLFPNFGITTKFKNWSMSDEFTSKISRPKYSEVTPYIYYINGFASIYGNPQVKPSFVYNFEHKFRYKKTSLGIGYNHTRLPRTFINLQDQTLESTNVMKVVNLNKLEKIYLDVRKSTKISFFYNYSMVNVSFDRYQSSVYDFGSPSLKPKIYAYSYNRFKIKNWFEIEVIGQYTSSFNNGKRTLRAQGELDLGISKSFANEKGFIQVTINDVFQTAKPSSYAIVDNNYYSATTTQDNRFLRVFVSYRFGKLKKPSYNHVNIDENEIQRAK